MVTGKVAVMAPAGTVRLDGLRDTDDSDAGAGGDEGSDQQGAPTAAFRYAGAGRSWFRNVPSGQPPGAG